MTRSIRLMRLFAIALGAMAEAGCVRAPSVDIIGSFFPAWMVCVTAAIIAAFLVRAVLVRCGLETEVGPLALFYPGLLVLFSCGLWLLFYR